MALTKSEARTSRIIFYAAAIVAVLYGAAVPLAAGIGIGTQSRP